MYKKDMNNIGGAEKMKLSKFRFDLPRDLMALYPSSERDQSRLMIVHKDTGKIEHRIFSDLINYVDPEDTLVINNTKVFPARLYGIKEKTGAKIEVLLLRKLSQQGHLWDVLVDPARKIRVGNKIFFGDGLLVAEVLDNTTSRGRTMSFHFGGTNDEFFKLIEQFGTTPLPENIGRRVEEQDKERYQTVYAEHIGAITVPSAGLHFTKHLVKRLEIKEVSVQPITLHMGLSNHVSVDVEDLSKFKMTSENFTIPEQTVTEVNRALIARRRVIAVGVSTAKALESSVSVAGKLKPETGWTNLFIFPPYDFKICTSLITNLHLPESTMLMLSCAFGGYECIMHAYEEAIKERYRFFNYGDAMLIL